MSIIDYLITSISTLPLIVTGPGFALCGLLALRAFGFFATFRWIKAATNLVYIFIVLLIMARYGEQIADFFQAENTPTTSQEQADTNPS